MCQGFTQYSGFLHHFVLYKLATCSIKVKLGLIFPDALNINTYNCSLVFKMIELRSRPLIRKLHRCPFSSWLIRVASSSGVLLITHTTPQGLSQDLETGCPKLAIVKFLGGLVFKGNYNILR